MENQNMKKIKHLIVNQNKKWRKIFLRNKKRVMDCDESFDERAGCKWKVSAVNASSSPLVLQGARRTEYIFVYLL